MTSDELVEACRKAVEWRKEAVAKAIVRARRCWRCGNGYSHEEGCDCDVHE